MEVDSRIGKANTALCELYCSVVTKRTLKTRQKLFIFKSIFVPIFINGHGS